MKINKTIALLLLTIVFALGLIACSKPTLDPLENTDDTVDTTEILAESKTRIVTDVWGREVEIPSKVQTIICLGSGAPRLAAYLNVMDMVIGVEQHDLDCMTVLRDYSPV